MNYLSYSTQTTVKIFLLFVCLALPLRAQTEQDTISNVQSVDSVFIMKKSPTGALWRSAVIPGWGQIYNESYWKAPIVLGFLGYNIHKWIQNNDNYHDKRREISAILSSGNSDDPDLSDLKRYRDAYRDNRDGWAFWIGITYFLNLVDAYVDAHMFDFDVKPDPNTFSPQLNIRVNF